MFWCSPGIDEGGVVDERRVNDVGGLAGGPVDQHEHAVSLFEKRVDALVMLLVHPAVGAFRVDAMRRGVEANTAEDYAALGYYVKWLRAVRGLLVEQGVLTDAEIEGRIAQLRAAS